MADSILESSQHAVTTLARLGITCKH